MKDLARSTVFYLFLNPHDGRYWFHDYGLHCGECFEALIDGNWVHTRIEHSASSTHSQGWFLVTHPEQPLRNLPVRRS